MVEVVEYALVVMASAMFAGASVAVYHGYLGFSGGVQADSALTAVTGLAWEAIQNGTSSGTVPLGAGEMTCFGGTLAISSDGMAASRQLPVQCDFRLTYGAGAHLVVFRSDGALLTAGVT